MKLKLKKMGNRELIESLFLDIEKLGFKIVDKEYNIDYYLDKDDICSICEFHIKEIPRFRFAVWRISQVDTLKHQLENNQELWTDIYKVNSKTELLFFTQYERDIDKFKPSRSGFLTGVYREAWVEQPLGDTIEHNVEEWEMYELERVLNFMKRHPIKAYIYSGLQIRNISEEISGIKCLGMFIQDWVNDKRYKLKQWLKLMQCKNSSVKLAKSLSNVYNVVLVLEPESYSPRLSILLRRKSDFDFEKCNKFEKIIDKFEDKWFMDISVEQYDLELSEKQWTDEDIKSDKREEEIFIKRLSYYYADQSCDYNILWCNCEELIDVKKIAGDI